MQDRRAIEQALQLWHKDAGCTYVSWFLWPDRLKLSRSIRAGLLGVAADIRDDKLGRQYRGTSLEAVVRSIAQQQQLFKGADHAFLWKPKLRIPDIYENRDNQVAFGVLLRKTLEASSADEVISAILELDSKQVKGLGPAVANLLYFVHPTFVPPFNTSIVKGYNAITGSRVKLGRWDEYLAMRTGMLRLIEEYRNYLSNDFGALAGFLFDVGQGRYAVTGPSVTVDPASWEADLAEVRKQAAALTALGLQETQDLSHTEVQGWLRDLGRALGFSVWIAVNDRSRAFADGALSDGCCCELPEAIRMSPRNETISRIDVLWLGRESNRVVAAFEIEHSTPIYSGILRLYDLCHTVNDTTLAERGLYVVAPDSRELEVQSQLQRPAFLGPSRLSIRYLSYAALEQHRDSMARFGEGLKAVEAIARKLT